MLTRSCGCLYLRRDQQHDTTTRLAQRPASSAGFLFVAFRRRPIMTVSVNQGRKGSDVDAEASHRIQRCVVGIKDEHTDEK